MRTPITYYGGKQTMLPHILPLVPEHQIYTESFAGGAALLFAKEPAPAEIINDLNLELVNFYNVVQCDYESLRELVNRTLQSRDVHAHARHILTYPSFFIPVERAWAVWACCKMGFASRLDGSFGYDRGGGQAKKLRNAKDNFTEELCKRLEHVTIESRDALQVIETYDTPNAFHFIDPPYVGTNCGHYADMFGRQELGDLLEVLSEVQGRFMLTSFPDEDVQKYVDKHGWHIHTVERTISASRTKRRKQEEWMVVNYEIEKQS